MQAGNRLSTISMVLSAGIALFAVACTQGGGPTPPSEVKQGWNQGQRSSWYQATQGSRLMPQSWARALEKADSQELFFTDPNLSQYRFLPLPGSRSGLPVGFAVDEQDASQLSYTNLTWYNGQRATEPWIGLNCSACHTARFTYQGQETTVDGGPSLLDFQGFIDGVDAAMAATDPRLPDHSKWDRFAARVLNGRDTPANRTLLRTAFLSLLAFYQDNARLNATPLRYGYGRLDAVGHILNKVAQLAVYETNPRVRATPNPADAPVNYPFLWDIYRHSRLQWNGIVASNRINIRGPSHYLDVGALGRNTGEVIGVFGDVVLRSGSFPHGFRSSVRTENLNSLEEVLRHLQPPAWPANFPALNPNRVREGQELFESRGCSSCHGPQPPGTPMPSGDTVFNVDMVALTRAGNRPNPNNTDPWMACNAITYTSAAAKLEGTRSGYIRGEPLAEEPPVATMLSASVIGTIIGDWREVVMSAGRIFLGIERLPRVEGAEAPVSPEEARAGRLDICFRANDVPREAGATPPFAYKARPLQGIWATAPYLHNGSVPTLYDLLLPPAQRPACFYTGTREYDPLVVGYRTAADTGVPNATCTPPATPAAPNTRDVRPGPGNLFLFTATGNGNSNEGHDYGVGRLTEEQRLALLEYLKSL
jgi:hypothetical protein